MVALVVAGAHQRFGQRATVVRVARIEPDNLRKSLHACLGSRRAGQPPKWACPVEFRQAIEMRPRVAERAIGLQAIALA